MDPRERLRLDHLVYGNAYVRVDGKRARRVNPLHVSRENGRLTVKCECCGKKTCGFDLHDYCARCGKTLCTECMTHGCCGRVPAESGMAEDHGGDDDETE